MNRYETLSSYAKDKKDKMEVLEMAAMKILATNQLDEKYSSVY